MEIEFGRPTGRTAAKCLIERGGLSSMLFSLWSLSKLLWTSVSSRSVSFVSEGRRGSMTLEDPRDAVVLPTVAASLVSSPIIITPVVPPSPSLTSILESSERLDEFDLGRDRACTGLKSFDGTGRKGSWVAVVVKMDGAAGIADATDSAIVPFQVACRDDRLLYSIYKGYQDKQSIVRARGNNSDAN